MKNKHLSLTAGLGALLVCASGAMADSLFDLFGDNQFGLPDQGTEFMSLDVNYDLSGDGFTNNLATGDVTDAIGQHVIGGDIDISISDGFNGNLFGEYMSGITAASEDDTGDGSVITLQSIGEVGGIADVFGTFMVGECDNCDTENPTGSYESVSFDLFAGVDVGSHTAALGEAEGDQTMVQGIAIDTGFFNLSTEEPHIDMGVGSQVEILSQAADWGPDASTLTNSAFQSGGSMSLDFSGSLCFGGGDECPLDAHEHDPDAHHPGCIHWGT